MKRNRYIANHPELFNLPAIHKPILPVRIVPVPTRIFGPLDELLSTSQVAHYWNISPRSINNYKFEKIGATEYSPLKFKYLEREVVDYTNYCYYTANIYGEVIDLPKLTLKDRLLTPSEVAERLKITDGTIANYRKDRRISFIKLSNSLFRFAERDLQIFLDRNYRKKMTYLDD